MKTTRRMFLGSAAAAAVLPSRAAIARITRDRFEAHEWGTFTTVASGKTTAIDWRPLAGQDDLPSFVYELSPARFGGKGQMVARVRMETPVIYFHAPKKMTCSVAVDFPEGTMTEWYPQATSSIDGKRLEWTGVTIDPAARPKLRREAPPSHYYPARETAAAPIRVNDEWEKFLFYRGVGRFDLPIETVPAYLRHKVRGRGLDHVIAFARSGNEVATAHVSRLDGTADPFSRLKTTTLAEVHAHLEEILVGTGLFRDEARAMIATWKDDWFVEGSRLFYLYPRPATDVILPLSITPKPDALVRTLVGRIEILTPDFERRVHELAGALKNEGTRAHAAAALSKNRFARCVLKDSSEAHVQLFLATQ